MVLESGKKSLENQLNGGRDVLSSMATKAATDSSLLLKRQDRLTVDRATNAVVRLPMSASLVFYVCVVLCVVCCVLCAVCCVRCTVCTVCCVSCVVGCVCVCLCHGCRRGSSGIKPTSSVEAHQELGCPPHGCKLMLKRMRTLISWPRAAKHPLAEWLTARGSCASMLRILFRMCSESFPIPKNSQQIMNTFWKRVLPVQPTKNTVLDKKWVFRILNTCVQILCFFCLCNLNESNLWPAARPFLNASNAHTAQPLCGLRCSCGHM